MSDGQHEHPVVTDIGKSVREAAKVEHPQDTPRGAGNWDDIELDTTAYSDVPGQLRFEYEALDACCDFEQGWFIDDLSALGCP